MPICITELKSFHPNYCSKKEIFFTGISPDHYSWLTAGTWIFKSAKVQLLFHFMALVRFFSIFHLLACNCHRLLRQKICDCSTPDNFEAKQPKVSLERRGEMQRASKAPTCEVINQANGRPRNNTGVHTGPAWYPDPGEKGWWQMRRSANFISAS